MTWTVNAAGHTVAADRRAFKPIIGITVVLSVALSAAAAEYD
jgi:hypothetical protein